MNAARAWLPRGAGLCAFLYYAITCAPSFFWLDSGELTASALGLGSPHPSGFPLYMLLAKAASFLPIGELAFRINLLSALCAAVAVGGVAKLVLLLGRDDWGTLAGALAASGTLAMGLLFARQATIAEVYAPTAALIVVTLLLLEAVARGGTAAVGLSLAWMAGLGFGLHPGYRALMGLPILALFSLRLYRGARWPLLAPMVTSLSALGVYLYLPVRSATGRIASLDWGHPDTLSKTLHHANAGEIREAFASEMMSSTTEIWWTHLSTFAQQLGSSLGLLCVLAAAVGLVVVFAERRTRWLGSALLVIVLFDGLYGFWLNPMGLVDLQNGVPLSIALCVLAGVAVATLARNCGPAAPFVGGVTALVMFLPPALVSGPALAQVGDLPRDVSEAALVPLVPGAALLTQSDSLSSGTTYLTTVEGARPDVAALVVQMLLDRERVREVLNASMPPAKRLASIGDNVLGDIASTGRQLYWQSGRVSPPRDRFLRVGPLVSALVDQERANLDTRQSFAQLSRLFAVPGHRDRTARKVLAGALTQLGSTSFRAGDLPWAQQIFEAATDVRSQHAAAWVNLGVLHSRKADLATAAELTEVALRHEPNRVTALLNAARYRALLDQDAVAQKHIGRALKVAGHRASAWSVAGIVDHRAGRLQRARQRLERALQLAPAHGEAQMVLRAVEAELAATPPAP